MTAGPDPRGAGRRRPSRLPVSLREGSTAHRTYVVAAWTLAVAAIVYVPFAADVGFAPASIDQPLRINQLNDVIAWAVAILGLNLVIGFSGQLSLGQSAFVGLGAYTTVILVSDHDWSYLATVPVSAGVCFVVGLGIGIPAARIRGQYLAIATLALAYVFPALVLKYGSLTGGTNGKGPARGGADLVPPSWLPFADSGRLASPLWRYCILVAMAAALFLLARNFVRSGPGRALMAVRDNALGAPSSGINVTVYRATAFAMSAVYGGLAGTMLMINRPFASEVQFSTRVAIFLVAGVVIGGAGAVSGAIPGAFVYYFVPYFVTQWTIDQRGIPPGLRQLTEPLFAWMAPGGVAAAGAFFGLTLLALVFLMPGGVVAGLRRLRERVVRVVPHPPWMDDVDSNSPRQGDARRRTPAHTAEVDGREIE